MKIPLCIPYIDEKEISQVVEVLKSGWFAHGAKNIEFEEQFAEFLGVKHSLSLNSCTSALQLAILANNIRGEVIIPSFTWVATANAVVTSGATPVFVDIDSKDGHINPNAIEAAINQNTEAIISVNFGGSVANMEAIQNICKKHGLLLIEDTAETIGGKYKKKLAGSYGIGCFSFFPTKNMTTGEGGMLTTNDGKLAQKVKSLLGHGIDKTTYERELKKKPWIRSASHAGFNFRMTNFQAAMGIEQLKKLNRMNELRRIHSFRLIENLENIENIQLMSPNEHIYHVFQMFTIQVKADIRTQFVYYLRKNGIGASVHFDPPVHKQPYYQNNYNNPQLPETEKLSSEIVTLPMYPQLTNKQLDYIVEIIHKFFTTQ
ncbi:DegT/DnrJ/EryC1/StrS family aminotransferase [Bacteroidota bacterium]